MSFYYPLRLGRRRRVSPIGAKEERGGRPRKYEAWREGIHRSLVEFEYEEDAEARVLERLLSLHRTNRFWLILGEPGSGKTTLLEAWFGRLAGRLTKPVLGAVVPVLVRLRSVPSATWRLNDEASLADALWNASLSEKALLESGPSRYYEPKDCRTFEPIWLLDGLDEVPPEISQDESFFQRIANLPGRKLASARTAVYESQRKTGDRYKMAASEYEILGLRAIEQRQFLREALPCEENQAEQLFENIQHNIQVRLLATSPLMLSLMAEVAGGSGTRIPLPASRAEFYQRAIDEMWHRKLKTDPLALRLREERDQYLKEKAATMGLASLRGQLPSGIGADLERGLRVSGLVRVDDLTRSFEFVHLTFQEYYLAQSLANNDLRANLEKYWSDSRYEEMLALLISLLARERRYDEIVRGIKWLVEWGQTIHDKNPEVLWDLGSSPLRVVCHVLSRSAISIPQLDSFLASRGLMQGSSLRKLALSYDPLVPLALLIELARDENEEVRRNVARNDNTPPTLLRELARDQHEEVRENVAGNPNTPLNLLAELARDVPGVRGNVADNPNTPPDLLAELARDQYRDVRGNVADNPNTPLNLLAELARDVQGVRGNVAGNTNTPPNLLTELINDVPYVRGRVAGNLNIPLNLLAELAVDKHMDVREIVAGNPNTPPNLLSELAFDENWKVRARVAENANTPLNMLAILARNEHEYVRRIVAENPNTPPNVLAELAEDEVRDPRWYVAANPNTPSNLLARLARDYDDEHVRRYVAENPSTPPNILAELARDENRDVRRTVAANANTLLEDLRDIKEEKPGQILSKGLGHHAGSPQSGK